MLKRILLVIVLIGLLYGLNYAWRALPIISGYGAKNLCSCVFVSGREAENVKQNELKVNPLLSLGTFELNMKDSSATGSVFGLVEKKAIYRRGLGCTLLSERSENEVKSHRTVLTPFQEPSDSIVWPLGSHELDTTLASIDYALLQQAVDNAFLENDPDAKINTRGVVVVHKGIVVAEKYAVGFDRNTPQMGWSMTKSVTSTIIGMMIKDKLIALDDTGLFEHWKEDERNEISLDQLLRMSSGLAWEEVYSGPSKAVSMLYEKADMGLFASEQDLSYKPDEQWYYSSGTTNILSKFIRNTLGEKEYLNYVRKRLFNPLSMTSAVLEVDASGTYVGSSYMYATPRDWAKFGLLYLNEGYWNGKQLLPDFWNEYIMTRTKMAPQGNYGGHFWLNAGEENNRINRVYPDAPIDTYSANGFEGQRVFIIPSKDLVIVRMGQTKVRGSFDFNIFLKEILAALD